MRTGYSLALDNGPAFDLPNIHLRLILTLISGLSCEQRCGGDAVNTG